MPTISEYVNIDFDLSDFEDDIEQEYCNGNCLKDYGVTSKLQEYVKNLYRELYEIPECNKKIKTIEEIYDDLYNMIRE